MRKFIANDFEVLDEIANFIKDMATRTPWRETDNLNMFVTI